MKWNQINPYYLESECANYRISKSYVHNTPTYTPWILTGRVDKHGNWWGKKSLDVCPDAETAKRLIENGRSGQAG